MIGRHYDFAGDFHEDRAVVWIAGVPQNGDGGQWGYIDKKGNPVIKPQNYDVRRSETYIQKQRIEYRRGEWGFVYEGESFRLLEAYHGWHFSEGVAIFWFSGDDWGFIDTNGRKLASLKKYDVAYPMQEGYARVKSGGYEGFVDKDGVEVIPLRYLSVSNFHEGLARVDMGGVDQKYCGFIDRTGAVTIPLIYERAGQFCNNIAFVRRMKSPYLRGSAFDGFIDKKGVHYFKD